MVSNPTDGNNNTKKDNNYTRFQSFRRRAPGPTTMKGGGDKLRERATVLKETFDADSEDGRGVSLAAEASEDQEGLTTKGDVSKRASARTAIPTGDSESEEEWNEREALSESVDEMMVAETRTDRVPSGSMVVGPTRLEYGRNVEQHDRTFLPQQPQQPLVGAQRVVGQSFRGFESDTSGSLIIGGGNDDDRSLDGDMQSYPPRARPVSDPVVALEVGADRTDELIQQFEHEREQRETLFQSLKTEQDNKRKVVRIGAAVFLLLAVVVAVVLTVVFVGGGDDSTPSPTPAPTSQQEALWVNLIQSRMSSIAFEDPTSPQRQALDWMSQDEFTLDLDNNELVIQRFALAVLYYATSGPTLWNEHNVGWLTSRPECEWGQPDLKCHDDGVVYWMGLRSDGLSGTLPKELGLLTKLEWLNIHSNHFPGTIPTEIGLMTSLRHIDVRACNLGGTIPTELCLLTKLTWLHVGANEFVGTIHSELGKLTALVRLDLATNNLSGSIHSELGKLTALTWLNLPNNDLSGTIPTEIVFPNLELVGANFNYKLTGLLPTELGGLTTLKNLYLAGTQVTGTIAPNLCDTLLDPEIDCFNIKCDCCLGFNGSDLVPCAELIMMAEDTV